MTADLADRRARNEYGYTAWGLDWLRLAEPMTVTRPDPALPRARQIARTTPIDLAIEGRIARATIARGGKASVAHVEFEPMTRETATALAELGLPITDETHAHLVTAGHSPAPVLANADCSCRARNTRCLHVLTLLYLLVRRVDDDPALALTLQGYHDASDQDGSAEQAPRWIPLSAIDPARFYDPT